MEANTVPVFRNTHEFRLAPPSPDRSAVKQSLAEASDGMARLVSGSYDLLSRFLGSSARTLSLGGAEAPKSSAGALAAQLTKHAVAIVQSAKQGITDALAGDARITGVHSHRAGEQKFSRENPFAALDIMVRLEGLTEFASSVLHTDTQVSAAARVAAPVEPAAVTRDMRGNAARVRRAVSTVAAEFFSHIRTATAAVQSDAAQVGRFFTKNARTMCLGKDPVSRLSAGLTPHMEGAVRFASLASILAVAVPQSAMATVHTNLSVPGSNITASSSVTPSAPAAAGTLRAWVMRTATEFAARATTPDTLRVANALEDKGVAPSRAAKISEERAAVASRWSAVAGRLANGAAALPSPALIAAVQSQLAPPPASADVAEALLFQQFLAAAAVSSFGDTDTVVTVGMQSPGHGAAEVDFTTGEVLVTDVKGREIYSGEVFATAQPAEVETPTVPGGAI
jgi:hypothetical protein